MKLSKRTEAMLRDRHSHIHTIELTEKDKERINQICAEIMDELVKRTKGPAEALMVLTFLTASIEETQNISGFSVEQEKPS